MILLFGPTGAGKSMQGQMLAVRMGWKWLSTGQMLRESTDANVIEVLKSGELVSDELTYEVFERAEFYIKVTRLGKALRESKEIVLHHHLKTLHQSCKIHRLIHKPF
jgi:cytidylate kinase